MRKLLLVIAVLLSSTKCFAAMHETVWHPDTCDGCVVTYEWDDALPIEQRVMRFKSILVADKALADLKGEAQYNAILERNQRKNKVYKEITDTVPEAVEEVRADDGSMKKTVKDFQFRYDAEGNLVVSADGLDDSKTFNAEKVIVE